MKHKRFLVSLVLAAQLFCTSFLFSDSIKSKVNIGIYSTGKSISETEKLFEGSNFETLLVTNDNLSDFCSDPSNILVLPPGQILNIKTEIRKIIHSHLSNSGNLIVLNPKAFAFDELTLSGPVEIEQIVKTLDFADKQNCKLVKGAESNFEYTLCDFPRENEVLQMGLPDQEAVEGSAFVEFPVKIEDDLSKFVVQARVKGHTQLDILTVRVFDENGQSWVGFAELTSDWDDCQVAFADMLPEGENERAVNQADPSKINKIQLGIDSNTVWGEASGSIFISEIKLSSFNRSRYPLSGNIIRYRKLYEKVNADFPDWMFDPLRDSKQVKPEEAYFCNNLFNIEGSMDVSGTLTALPERYETAGGNPETFIQVIKSHATRRIPFIKMVDSSGIEHSLARLDIYSDGDYAGASVALFGLPESSYQDRRVSLLLQRLAMYMANSPKILDCTTNIKDAGNGKYDFQYRVYVHNPQSDKVKSLFHLDIADGTLSGRTNKTLAAGKITELDINCGGVPEDFPFTKFNITLNMRSAAGNDLLSEDIDIEKTLEKTAKHFIHLQSVNFMDAAYTHWFYGDVYAARMMRAFGEYTNNQNYINSAMRWAHMIAATQTEDGAFIMGYGMRRRMYFVGDNGSISLAMVQLASHGKEYEKKLFLDAAEKNFDWIEQFLVTPERSEQLAEEFGENAKGTTVGYYGIGMVCKDYVTDILPDTEFGRPEYRGFSWTLACSMGFRPGLARLTGDSRYLESARGDAVTYIENDLTTTGYAPEGLVWLHEYLYDDQLREEVRKMLVNKFIEGLPNYPERFWLKSGSRQTLIMPALVYCMHHIENSQRTRAAVLRTVIGLCGDYSPYSMLRVGLNVHKCTFQPANNESLMYLRFGAMGLMEVLEPDSTMLKMNYCDDNEE
ncbi:hypothetical protein SMSP2_00856 [Limihaloglobus sulfuriphilus]|uniref:Uncharacterized protein n=1 Tax=Limihaloglobus sulfuriphilus TaxID=1851148 RepID=A0A1Q2MCX1_9BACT|nr:hypothetical protein [Limihaloglobus sulfuriphilus]AQQ70504.1 hypothetical protein SMSP2_00856 [Limihaloglobus sulfuriphilus]